MKPQKPLFWHQGLFLEPQHFQYQDQYIRSLLSPLENLQPYFWGVNRLEIREEALNHRSLELTAGEFLYPDGTSLIFPGNAIAPPRSFENDWVEEDKPLVVFLGMHKWNPAGENVTVLPALDDLSRVSTRLVSPEDPDIVLDQYQPGPEAQLKKMVHLLKIFWENEVGGLGDYDLLPIMVLKREGEEIKPSKQFIPPTTFLSGSPILFGILKDIRDQVASRCRQMQEYKLPRGMDTSLLEPGYLFYLQALQALNRALPLLQHFIETPLAHPWVLYGFLRQCIGELSTFSSRVDALGELPDGTKLLPFYDHRDLWACFSEARTLVAEILGEIVTGPKYIIHLVRKQNQFSADIPAGAIDPRNEFYLLIKTGTPEEEVLKAVQNLIKASSVQAMPTLISRALPGLPLIHHGVAPPGLPRRPDSFYFLMDKESPHWGELTRNQNVCLSWDRAPQDVTAEVIVIRSPR
jgi:type VI secretion system protein ImpJ